MPMSIDEIKAVVQLKLEELIVLRVSDERKTETIKKLTQENEGLCVALEQADEKWRAELDKSEEKYQRTKANIEEMRVKNATLKSAFELVNTKSTETREQLILELEGIRSVAKRAEEKCARLEAEKVMSKAELLVAFEKARKLEKITAELQEKMACFGKFVGELNDSLTEIKCARNKIFTEYQETSTKVKNLTVDNENLTVEIVNLRFRLTTLESERRSQIAASPEMEKILACKDEEISILQMRLDAAEKSIFQYKRNEKAAFKVYEELRDLCDAKQRLIDQLQCFKGQARGETLELLKQLMKRSETHDSVDEKDRLQAEANIFAISAAQDFSLTPTDSQLMEMCKDFDTEKSFTADGSVREPEE